MLSLLPPLVWTQHAAQGAISRVAPPCAISRRRTRTVPAAVVRLRETAQGGASRGMNCPHQSYQLPRSRVDFQDLSDQQILHGGEVRSRRRNLIRPCSISSHEDSDHIQGGNCDPAQEVATRWQIARHASTPPSVDCVVLRGREQAHCGI